jgi:hypothetical protein
MHIHQSVSQKTPKSAPKIAPTFFSIREAAFIPIQHPTFPIPTYRCPSAANHVECARYVCRQWVSPRGESYLLWYAHFCPVSIQVGGTSGVYREQTKNSARWHPSIHVEVIAVRSCVFVPVHVSSCL